MMTSRAKSLSAKWLPFGCLLSAPRARWLGAARNALGVFLMLMAVATAPRPVAAEPLAKGRKDGFSASVMVTSDPDWRAKLDSNVPGDAASLSDCCIQTGGRATFLIFFRGPKVKDGQIYVECSATLTNAVGDVAEKVSDQVCGIGEPSSDPDAGYVANVQAVVTAQSDAPKGNWVYDVTVRDVYGGVEIPLQVQLGVFP